MHTDLPFFIKQCYINHLAITIISLSDIYFFNNLLTSLVIGTKNNFCIPFLKGNFFLPVYLITIMYPPKKYHSLALRDFVIRAAWNNNGEKFDSAFKMLFSGAKQWRIDRRIDATAKRSKSGSRVWQLSRAGSLWSCNGATRFLSTCTSRVRER